MEVIDGTAAHNQSHYRLSVFYDLAKTSVIRLAWAQARELKPYGCTALTLTPGWLRSEIMLSSFGVSETNWKDTLEKEPHFIISESHLRITPLRRPCRRCFSR